MARLGEAGRLSGATALPLVAARRLSEDISGDILVQGKRSQPAIMMQYKDDEVPWLPLPGFKIGVHAAGLSQRVSCWCMANCMNCSRARPTGNDL